MSAATAQTTQSKRANSREQGRVLLVTDEPSARAYGAALERAGFAVVGVAGGVAAAVELRRSRPHVVIADAKMKGLTHVELARLLSQGHNSVPLVLAGHEPATLQTREAALAVGAFDYFQVPSEMPLLIARTTQLVTLSQTLDHLRAEANRDYLTGLSNRRRFRTALGQELERWRRYHVPCALLLVDIDFLKRINDAHGHSAGDVVIRHVASALTEHSRDNDTAARLGGEEFALLLAGTDSLNAFAAAERLRHAVSVDEIDGIGTVTVSLGVASCPAHATTERTLYAATDAALYRAKDDGRNRSVLAPEI